MGLARLRLVSEPLNQLSRVVPACTHHAPESSAHAPESPAHAPESPTHAPKAPPMPKQPGWGSQDGLGGAWVSAQDSEACGSEAPNPGHGRRLGRPARWTGPLIAQLWKERLEVPPFYRCPQTRML